MDNSIIRGMTAYVNFAKNHIGLVLLAFLLSTVIGIFISSKLVIRGDLKELLPDNYQSVKDINLLLERVGGIDNLIVVAEGPNVEANKRFMDDLALRLKEIPEGKIRYIDYKSDEVRDFYEKYFLYYIDQKDIDRLYKSVERRIDYEKVRHSPLFIEFTDEDPLLSEIDDIKEKNQKNYSAPIQAFENYYGGEWGRMLIMLIRPLGATLGVDQARGLLKTVQEITAQMDPSSYDPRLKVGFCGNVVSTVEEYDTLKTDILSTALLCLTLVSLIIVIYFLRIRIIFLLGATLVVSLSWTFATTYFLIGYLNTQTAFIGSIIVGTGINYGIIVMARYIEERKKMRPHTEAMNIAVTHTMSSTFLAAATTAVAFIILLLAKIKGLSQFGAIGAIGIIFCWLGTVFFLPVITLWSERIRNMVEPKDRPRRASAIFTLLTKWVVHSPAKILFIFVILTGTALVLTTRYLPSSIEYDFTKMRNKTSLTSGTEALEKRVSKLFKDSMTPAVVLVDDMNDAPRICEAVNKKNMSIPETDRRVGSCYSIFNLLPSNQESKLPKIERFRSLFKGNKKYIDKLDPDLREKIDQIRGSLGGELLTLTDVPKELKKHFEDLNGDQGVVVFVNPRPGMPLSDGKNLIRFADTIKNIELGDGRIFHAAGASFIFSDLVKAIVHEGPILTLASFIFVLIFVITVARRWKISWVVSTSICVAVILMLGVMAILDIKLNFFNFIVLPLTFGIGVDYSINVAIRLARDRLTNIEHSLRFTGGAVILCSLTTIIGYAVLIAANNQALASLGLIAIVGEFTSIGAAMLFVPALMVLLRQRRSRSVSNTKAPCTEGQI